MYAKVTIGSIPIVAITCEPQPIDLHVFIIFTSKKLALIASFLYYYFEVNVMIEFIGGLILKIFPISSMPYWIALIVIFLLVMAFALTKAIPRIIENNIKQKNEYKSAHQLQIESYFRDISGTKLEDLFADWTDTLARLNTDFFVEFSKSRDNIEYLLRDTIMYGSDRTIDLAGLYAQFIHGYNDNNKDSGDQVKNVAYIASIISSLKLDFSGYYVEPQLILKMKLTNWEDIKEEMVEYLTEIEKQVTHDRNN